MFSNVRPAYRCLPIGSLGGRDKITSEVWLLHTTHDAQHTSGKKIYRAKTPNMQSKTFTHFSELGASASLRESWAFPTALFPIGSLISNMFD
jgi:hypothetical protein